MRNKKIKTATDPETNKKRKKQVKSCYVLKLAEGHLSIKNFAAYLNPPLVMVLRKNE